MTRAYAIYFLMAATLAAGLWLILTLGDSLRAPDDLAGAWTVHWDHTPPTEVPDKTVMHIDQSGRFFTIRFHDGPTWRMKLNEKWRGAREGRQLSMILTGDTWTMRCTGSIRQSEPRRVDDMRIEVEGGKVSYTGYAARRNAQLTASEPPSTPPAPAPKTADAR